MIIPERFRPNRRLDDVCVERPRTAAPVARATSLRPDVRRRLIELEAVARGRGDDVAFLLREALDCRRERNAIRFLRAAAVQKSPLKLPITRLLRAALVGVG